MNSQAFICWKNDHSNKYCQFTYPIDAFGYENIIDGYEFTLIGSTCELYDILRLLKVDKFPKEFLDHESNLLRFGISYKGIIRGCIVLYKSHNYKFYLPIPCDEKLITTINKWLNSMND